MRRIDWERHWAGAAQAARDLHDLARDLETAQALAGSRRILRQPMRTLAAYLGSRHVPQALKDATPGIPWRALACWRLIERKRSCCPGHDPIVYDPAVLPMLDFALRVAPVVVGECERLKDLCTMIVPPISDLDQCDGLLDRTDHTAGWSTLTLRVPTSALSAIAEALGETLTAEAPLSLDEAHQRLAVFSAEIAALGVAEVAIYGSVARCEAKRASDVDVAYAVVDDSVYHWEVYSALTDILERAFGKVVDAHLYERRDHTDCRLDERWPSSAATVWMAGGRPA